MTGRSYTTPDGKFVLNIVDMANEKGAQLAVRFYGKSQMKDPGVFMNPILSEVLEEAKANSKNIVLDFCNLEFMNSSTVSPILKYWSKIKGSPIKLTLVYRKSIPWQKANFSAFLIFAKDSDQFHLVEK